MTTSVRKKAVLILMNIEKNSAYINIEMNKLRSENNFTMQDLHFIGEIVNGVIKHKITLDYVIDKHSKVKVKKISPYVLAVLRSGIYQLLYMDKVPDSAAVNESVKLIKKSSVSRLAGFVNAVMRAVTDDDISSLPESDVNGLSIKYSFPVWIIERWVNRYGIDFTVDFVRSLNLKPPFFIRCNCLKNSPDDLKQLLNQEDVEYTEFFVNGFSEFNTCLKLQKVNSLYSMRSFNDGLFYIQDPAAALAAYIADPKPGDTVIDMCSAPGGKSIFMAELMENRGKIFACDIYEHKIKLIKDNCQKYGADIIEPMLSDATVYQPEFAQRADCVLCDVPCSGLGIIRKKPDIKYSRSESDLEALAQLSLKILDNASKYLKKGGILVFSTCTVEPEENETVCLKFLEEHRDFSSVAFGDSNCYSKGCKTFFPHIDGTDGFFVAKFVKTE